MIENAAIPAGVVAPGTVVRYRELDTKEENEIRILGPWDGETENDISYRSPLAQGILGSKAGDKVTVTLPTGTQDVEVLSVGIVPLVVRS